MQVTSGIQCNLLSPSYSTIYAPQGDAKSRFVLIQLLEGAAAWDVPTGALVTIRAAKPDGTVCFYDTNEQGESAYTVDGSTVTIELVGQVLAVPGTVLMQVDFYNADGAHLSTFTFRCQVSESAISDEDIVSSDYFSVLTSTLTEMLQIEQAVKAAYGAPLVAATAAAMTDHTRVYVYTGSESGFVNGNWYYWDGTAWASGGVYNSSAVNVDSAPTQGSTNPVSSGGTYTAIANEAAAREAADTALGDELDDVKSALNSIEDFSWSPGFINVNGNVDSASDPNRQHSDYLICPPETNIAYVAETNHSAILGISFYDENKSFISGVANNGSMGTAQTVASPKRTRYCRISTKLSIVSESYYAPATRTLEYIEKTAMNNKDDLSNRTEGFIKFGTYGSIRGQAESIDGLLYAQVVDNDYDISLYYLNAAGTETNTQWLKYFLLADYKKPTKLMIRKTDNSAMPTASANEAVRGIYLSGLATNKYVYQVSDLAYVDGTDGADTNNGINPTTAFKTIQKAIDLGYKKILVREGTYTGGINLNRKNGVDIRINKSFSAFDASTANKNPKVIIDCDSTLNNGVKCLNCADCTFEGIEVKNAVKSGWYIEKCDGIVFNDCVAHDCPTGMGFELWNTNADFINCGCYNIGTYGGSNHRDGFNLHGTGTQNFKNCWANYCEDDGISHHDACEGYVDGGEWHHCGKGGICTPTHGAKVDVSNVYAHDCGYGIYAGNDTPSLAKTFNITNCVCLNNTVKDIYVTNNTANIWNCIYETIDHNGSGTNNILSVS